MLKHRYAIFLRGRAKPMNELRKDFSIIAVLKGVGVGICISFIVLLLFGAIVTHRRARLHTEYAPNYSVDKFKQLKVGMSEQDVVMLVGEPFDRLPDTSCMLVRGGEQCRIISPKVTWYYSRQDETDTDYYVRYVEIEDGKVTQVVKSFYAD